MSDVTQSRRTGANHLQLAREYTPVVLALVFGLALSFGLQRMMREQVYNLAQYDFSEEAKTCIGAIERELDANIDLVRWLGATFRASPQLDRGQFQALTAALQESAPPSVTLLWVPRVDGTRRDAFEAGLRQPGGPATPIFEFGTPGDPVPSPLRPEHFPVQFSAGMASLIGFDFASDPVLQRYLDLSRDKATMFFVSESAPIQQFTGNRSILALCPVFAEEPAGTDSPARTLLGFSAGIIQVELLTEHALAGLLQPEVDLHVFDMFGPAGEQFLHFRPGASQDVPAPYVEEAKVRLLPEINYVGAIMLGTTRRWLIACTPAPAFAFGIQSWSPLLGLAIGLSFTITVAYHFFANIRQRRLAEETVVRRTAELERTNERLVHEVAERKRFEMEREDLLALLETSNASLQQLNHRLERSNRDLQDFALVASHDLKEPLRKVRVLAQSLRDKWSQQLDGGAIEYLDLMEGALQRMHNLITNLLRVSRVTTHGQPFVRVEMSNVISDVLSDLAVRIEETAGQIDVGPIPAIDADPMQMRQLFQNILDNSLKYHREGVPPHIQVEAVTHPDNGDPGTCTIILRDNGIGFAPDLTERAFTLFQRLENGGRVEGSGVGLAVCRKIAERHGGAISIQSQNGMGSTFTITLPLEHRGHRDVTSENRE